MITAQDLLNFADNLCRNNETDDRVCINRAYYAAMHKSLENAQNNGYKLDRHEAGGAHSNLIFFYEKQADDNSLLIADLLRKLKRRRQQADYCLTESVFSSHAMTAIRQAKEIFALT